MTEEQVKPIYGMNCIKVALKIYETLFLSQNIWIKLWGLA